VEKSKNSFLDRLEPELKVKIEKKEKLSIDEQIEYLKAKGIQFNEVSVQEAKIYLSGNSYYYKVTAYRKNFPKSSVGRYENLDFAHLKDLSILDMHLRYLIIKMSLDLEHSLKSIVINAITEDEGEDGYRIIDEYNAYEKEEYLKKDLPSDDYIHVKDKILKEVKNPRDYNYDFYNKSKDNLSIWKLIEMMSYGQLSSFIKFYVDTSRFKSRQLKDARKLFHYSKNVRDSAAHSRPILNDITIEKQMDKPNIIIKNYVIQNGLDSDIASRLLTNFKINDLCSLIFLHNQYINGKYMRKARRSELVNLLNRVLYKKIIYKDVSNFSEITNLFFRLIKRYKV